MNIFFSSHHPSDAAQNLDFYIKLRNKMILESTQLIFNTVMAKGFESPYKPAHPHHECCLWLLQDYANYFWLVMHLHALHRAYNEASGKVHKSYGKFLAWNNKYQEELVEVFPTHRLTLPFLAFSEGNEDLEEKYGHYEPNPYDEKKPYAVANSFDDAVIAYREYLKRKPYAQGLTLTFV